MADLDRIDFKILTILQNDNQISNAELADTVGVSAPTCLRRVRRLREEGVIIGDVAIVDPAKIGSNLMIVVEVELSEEDTASMKEFEQNVVSHKLVKQCYLVTGETDYVLFVSTLDMREYESFASEMFFSNKLVKKFKTLMVMNRLKNDTKVDVMRYKPSG
ncbi:Lrp/AsnC family transcriptional regulator [Rhizobium panacihumi]|uniref:Lrp/AsnC family transcriptional regulator n=1 Tax=Rhizobium panacihumi TaxID=2008450 RepID=UPI003D7A42CF